MAVRERDDTGWDELPGGLSFSGSESDDDLEQPGGRRWLSTAVWVLVLGVLLGGGGAWGLRWSGQADVRAVLASSTATYTGVLERLREAPDAAALASVAARAPDAAESLDDDLARLDSSGGSRRAAVAGQVIAERDVLRAVAALGDVDAAPLRVWGDAHAELTAAVAREQQARAALLLVDPTAAGRLPDTPRTVRRLAATVGQAVVGDVALAAGELLAGLSAATRTADLRAVAEQAEAQRIAVTAAAAGLGGGTDGAVLAAFGDALLAVAELRALTPDEPAVWEPVRARLQSALQVVASADGSVAAGTVRGRLPLVLEAVDRLVARAEQAQMQWRPVHDAAVAVQSADAAALRAYTELVRAGASGWPALRTGVEGLAGAPPETLDDVWAGVDGLRITLVAAVPPAALQAAHDGLVAAVGAVELPLREVREGSATDVSPAVDALPGWEPALVAWEAAAAAAEAEVSTRVLPPAPDV